VIEQLIAIAAVAGTDRCAYRAGGQAEHFAVGHQIQVARFRVRIRRRRRADRAAGDGRALVGDLVPAESGVQARLPLARKLQGQACENVELLRVREQPGFVGRAGDGGVHLALGERAGEIQRQHIAELLHAIDIQAVPLRSRI
jgi:hypothetical protein